MDPTRPEGPSRRSWCESGRCENAGSRHATSDGSSGPAVSSNGPTLGASGGSCVHAGSRQGDLPPDPSAAPVESGAS